jgi:glucarate dehydratase
LPPQDRFFATQELSQAHVAASVPNLDYACDTHYPWQEPDEEVIKGGKLPIVDGCVKISRAPGLGLELDHDQLAGCTINT